MHFLGILVGISSALTLYDRFFGNDVDTLRKVSSINREALYYKQRTGG
jgi:hypothetical protein